MDLDRPTNRQQLIGLVAFILVPLAIMGLIAWLVAR